MTIGHKISGAIKTIGSKFLQLGANYIGSKGNIRSALGKTILQSIPSSIIPIEDERKRRPYLNNA